jgi:hypothetical protein
MAVVWAIVTTVLWAVLAVGLGRSKSDLRLLTMLVISGVAVALVCAHAYAEGWKSGGKAERREAAAGPRSETNPPGK